MNKVILTFSLFLLASCNSPVEKSDEKAGDELREPLFCTQDAKICPDGSAVSRDPLNQCQFKPCPSEKK